jgi:4-diphosphocytidyl-2-C-methyl-D-erythritol kinase
MRDRLAVVCPAKINLTLEVLGRRADGYHELRTIFQAISLADDLVLRRGAGGAPLTVTGVWVPVEGNLCLRAVAEFRRHREVPTDVTMHLHKRIPVGAGLGGGSSDAAGVLVGLDHWFGPVGDELLLELAASLGSDVPFCLRGGTALGQGRGEVLERLPWSGLTWLVVARPGLQVSTAAAYGGLRPEDFTDGEHTAAWVTGLRRGCSLPPLAGGLYNAFERTVLEAFPEIALVKGRLLEAGAEAALLAGSGAAVFGLFANEQSARRAAAALGSRGLWSAAAMTLPDGAQVIGET